MDNSIKKKEKEQKVINLKLFKSLVEYTDYQLTEESKNLSYSSELQVSIGVAIKNLNVLHDSIVKEDVS